VSDRPARLGDCSLQVGSEDAASTLTVPDTGIDVEDAIETGHVERDGALGGDRAADHTGASALGGHRDVMFEATWRTRRTSSLEVGRTTTPATGGRGPSRRRGSTTATSHVRGPRDLRCSCRRRRPRP